ncbi:MAG: 4'-phosphopantetheinyl transferase superfamily protein [Proteobacteria bacterium]|nr:4'-phosphopantetheinyl transferase superfamily protein [Verrucomicrobiota bacterium]NBU08674.1 4'-phosphopantetheinyl transferase superfamily protein [Pseudomonadota bacterium]
MIPDWQTLFVPRPLAARAMQLPLAGLEAPVWFASASSADLNELPPETFLAEAECARSSEFKFGQPRENFTLGRLAGKLALAAAGETRRDIGATGPLTPTLSPSGGEGEDFALRLRSIEISNGERGEPVVRVGGWNPTALGVSLSHVNGLGVAVAFPAGARVGLDVELIDAKRAETVRKGVPLSGEEESWLKSTALPEATALLLLWTARESLGKALGTGLACKWESLALREIERGGEGVYSGSFLHQPQFRCISRIGAEAVMSLAFEIA